MALQLQGVTTEQETEYNEQFMDMNVCSDELARNIGISLQSTINQLLFNDESNASARHGNKILYCNGKRTSLSPRMQLEIHLFKN